MALYFTHTTLRHIAASTEKEKQPKIRKEILGNRGEGERERERERRDWGKVNAQGRLKNL